VVTDPSQLLDVVISKARQLREVGVLRVRLEGLSFDLAPREMRVEEEDDDRDLDMSDDTSDPFNDPTTYGGGRVPGFRRRPHEEHGR
jgi:hypothetical protein